MAKPREDGICVNGDGCVFCLMVVVGFFVYDSGWIFVLMVVTMLFVYCENWVFCLWQWPSFCVGGYVFCLMVVMRFLFMVVAEFLC